MNVYSMPNCESSIVYILEDDNTVYIDSIFTPYEHRNKGYGSNVLNSFLSEYLPYVDVTLLASPILGFSINRVVNWYKRHGFVEVKSNSFGVEMICKKL